MLKFDGAWRFHSPEPIADGVQNEFFNLIGKTAAQGNRKRMLEYFKSYFANAAGITSSSSSSSSESWAESDLDSYMTEAATNAALFIEAFYDACSDLKAKYPDFAVPDVQMINSILAQHKAGYEVKPPDLIARNPVAEIPVPKPAQSLDEQAQEIIQQSLKQSEHYLTLGQNRQAVQEILWLLETISTLFQGLSMGKGTVQGKYFNKISADLRKYHKGTTLEQALKWATELHGYLSSPTGGGVRHGVDLRENIAMTPNDARLFCNLIRSYITFLIAEHERLSS